VSARGARYPVVAVYADESCLGNGRAGDNPGGAGALLEYVRPGTGEMVRRDLWISEPATTNNRMALRSVIESFRALSRKGQRFSVVFTSDSRYLIDGLSSWVHSWAKRGWTRKGGQIENLALWHEAIAAIDAQEVDPRWVRGHHGHPQNEYANHLATRAAARQDRSDGLVLSEFEAWLAAERARGVNHGVVAPFPDAASFQPTVRLPSVTTGRP
jgi:ribonuclease HI